MRSRYLYLLCIALLATLALASTATAKGKKYALFVGINDYPGVDSDLNGAVTDAKNMKSLLETRFGFLARNNIILTDGKATRQAILDSLKSLGAKAGAGDMLVFQYSGHGSLFPDAWSAELDETEKTEVHATFEDGSRLDIPLDLYDSSICPWDVDLPNNDRNWGNLILDDELYAIFAPMTAKGVHVVFISDSCHSGTVGKAEGLKGKVRFLRPEKVFRGKTYADLKLSAPAGQTTVRAREMKGSYIAMTAAKDNEFAMDSDGGFPPSGLFTTNLIATIKANKKAPSYKRLIGLVEPVVSRKSLALNNDQHPQVDGRFGNTNTTIFSLPLK